MLTKDPAAAWLAECTAATRTRLGAELTRAEFQTGQYVHRIHDPAQHLFHVRSGTIRICAASAEGKELIIRDLGPGSWFGFIGCFGSGTRPNDAVALTPSRLDLLPRHAVETLGAADPMIWKGISGVLAVYVEHYYKIYENHLFLPLSDRLLTTVRQLCKWHGSTRLSMSQNELAGILGVTKEAVGVNLQQLKAQGLVEIGYRSITYTGPAG